MKKIFYGFPCPILGKDTKFGITGNARMRLAVYGMSYSSRAHRAQFGFGYYGSSRAIEKLEIEVKKYFDDFIDPAEGRTEWVKNHTLTEIETKVDEIIKGHRFKIKKLPPNLLPITEKNLNEVHEYILNN